MYIPHFVYPRRCTGTLGLFPSFGCCEHVCASICLSLAFSSFQCTPQSRITGCPFGLSESNRPLLFTRILHKFQSLGKLDIGGLGEARKREKLSWLRKSHEGQDSCILCQFHSMTWHGPPDLCAQ